MHWRKACENEKTRCHPLQGGTVFCLVGDHAATENFIMTDRVLIDAAIVTEQTGTAQVTTKSSDTEFRTTNKNAADSLDVGWWLFPAYGHCFIAQFTANKFEFSTVSLIFREKCVIIH